MRDQLEQIADELGADVQLDEVDPDLDLDSVDGVQLQHKEVTMIKPFYPGNGFHRDENNHFTARGIDVYVTVKHRVQCPSCDHILADEQEPNQMSGSCSSCGVETCHRCQSRCNGCGTIMCPDCTSGHGLKDETYCRTCRSDVQQDIEFERQMEERQQQHEQELELQQQQLEQERQQIEREKQRREMELKEARERKEQLRKDWETVLNTVKQRKEMQQMEEQQQAREADVDGFGGSGAFQGSGAFDGNKELPDPDGDDSEALTPDWIHDADEDIEKHL